MYWLHSNTLLISNRPQKGIKTPTKISEIHRSRNHLVQAVIGGSVPIYRLKYFTLIAAGLLKGVREPGFWVDMELIRHGLVKVDSNDSIFV